MNLDEFSFYTYILLLSLLFSAYYFFIFDFLFFFFFFFQAEDGIRDLTVTGVQTCALPIFVYPALLQVRNFPVRKRYLGKDFRRNRWGLAHNDARAGQPRKDREIWHKVGLDRKSVV